MIYTEKMVAWNTTFKAKMFNRKTAKSASTVKFQKLFFFSSSYFQFVFFTTWHNIPSRLTEEKIGPWKYKLEFQMGLGINIGKIGSGINVRTYYKDIEPWNICQNIDLTLEYVFQQY